MFNQKLNLLKNRSLGTVNFNFPQMDSTLNGWETTITLVKVTQNIVEGDLVPTETNITFQGVIQPLRTEQLMSKPEGQRSWEWLWIHVKSGSLNLMTGDKIKFNNKRYKVMGVKDYSLNGFVEYEIVRDYENE